jgi:hypothetical protein
VLLSSNSSSMVRMRIFETYILHLLLWSSRSCLSRAFSKQSRTILIVRDTDPEENCWKISEEVIRSRVLSNLYCIVDAVDEYHDEAARQRFVDQIKILARPSSGRDKSRTVVKILLTSRPNVESSRALEQPGRQSLALILNLEIQPEAIMELIQHGIGHLGSSEDHQRETICLLNLRTEETFLWISIVLRRLEAPGEMLSIAKIRQLVEESLSDLTKL